MSKEEYKSPNTIKIRKKAGLKSTQEKDWEGVGLPIRKWKGKPPPKRSTKFHQSSQALSINWVKGQHIDKEINVKGGKGFKLRKKK